MQCRPPVMLAVVAMVAAGLASCAADPSDVPGAAQTVDDGLRVVEIEMIDMAFRPDSIDVTSGETIRLRFHNGGQAIHDAVVGDLAFQEGHDAEMAAGATHAADGAGDGETGQTALLVAPGDTADMVYTAGAAAALIIGCHQPGHWNAGMRAALNIT